MKRHTILLLLVCFAASASTQTFDLSISIEPALITNTYYDYSPGGLNINPLQIHSSFNETDNNVYVSYHMKPLATSERSTYLSYCSGTNIQTFNTGIPSTTGGYQAIDIDAETLDPLVAWHYQDAAMQYGLALRADLWHLNQAPGQLTDAAILPDLPNDAEGLWPSIHVGPSPEGNDQRRVYVFSQDADSDGSTLSLQFADFTTADLENDDLASLEWTSYTLPQYETWLEDPFYDRTNTCEMLLDDGVLVVTGFLTYNDDSLTTLFMLVNDNYGEGDWQTYTMPSEQHVPQTEDIYVVAKFGRHCGAQADANGRIHMPLLYPMMQPQAGSTYNWWVYYTYLRDVIFDPATGDIAINNLYPGGEESNSVYPPESGQSWPVFYPDADEMFFNHSAQITGDTEYGVMCAVWSDGLNAKYAADGDTLQQWAEAPEIALSFSANSGDDWCDPIKLNALETPELEGMIPCWVYPSDTMTYIGDGVWRVYLFFLDDFSYGSFVSHGCGENLGGNLYYMAVDVDLGVQEAGDIVPPLALGLTIAPNPFNPSTTLTYSLPAGGRTTLRVYNLLGQRVKTLVDDDQPAGERRVVWNGRDDNGYAVSSGVYFARLDTPAGTQTRKLLLLK